MFDFVNYTYNGVLSILSTLFGLSYPLILGCIEKIDAKYHSTKLSARFLEEKVFKTFKKVLVLNLVVAVVFPFFMDGSSHSRYYIAVQCVFAVLMIYYAFRLFNKIMSYYDAGELQKQILEDYHKAVVIKNLESETKYFTQWSDLTTVLLSSADESLVQSVYEEWFDYVVRKHNEYKGNPLELDDYFYSAVTRINEYLCKGERKPISVNNGNSLLTSLIVQDSIVTDKTYRYLWKNLRLQLFYKRDEWIMAYWKSASQKYELFMREISSFDIDDSTGQHYTDDQVSDSKQQREKFQEFHIMLCAMLLQEGKYELLEQMLFFSQSQPPSYPLVPSTLGDILKVFEGLNADRLFDVTYFEERYPMPNMHGITGGKILGAANCYMALLVYRLYVLMYPYGRDFAFRAYGLPENQYLLAKYKRDLDVLKYWLEEIKDNKKALAAIRVDDVKTITKNDSDGGVDYDTPEKIIEDIQNGIDGKLEDLKRNQPNDPEIIKKIENEVDRRIRISMAPFGEILGRRFERDFCYNLDSSISQFYPNSAFQANPDIGYAGIEDTTFRELWHRFSHLFASSFFQQHMQADYTVDSTVLFKALDKLEVSENHFAFVFGVYIDYYADKVEGLIKESDRLYNYNGMSIILLDSPSDFFSKRIYVIKKEDRPFLDFNEPSDEQKASMELKKFNDYGLWMSIQKIEGHKELVSDSYKEKLGEKMNLYSIFHAIWSPKLFFKESYHMVCIKVNYKMTDEGKTDTLEMISPFEVKEDKPD